MINTPAYSLQEIQSLLKNDRYRITLSANKSAVELGFDINDICDVIKRMSADDFYKSMQSKNNANSYQDVYHPEYGGYKLYVKVQIVEDLVIISFKKK